MKKNYTSQDVAEVAGVSQSTVSRVFAGNTNVSDKKRKKILEVAEQLDYKPNAQARSLITRKTMMVGIIMRNMRDPFYSAVLEIFHTRLSPLGYQLIFINSENEEIQESEIAKLLEYNVEGVIVTDALLSPAAAKKLKRYDIVSILFNRYTENLDSSAVYCDNYLAAKQIATYLVEQGHKSFAFISGPAHTSTTIDRLKGFKEVLNERNITDLIIESGTYTYESGFKAAQELVMRNKNIDCIFCGSDIIALGVMDAVRLVGLKIPEDISVVGFDNIRMLGWVPYPLTTWEQPLEDMVTSTVDLLIKEINDKNAKPQVIVMKGHLVIRNTVKTKS
ncbi:LacI family DNA-binding transcriptional regulator [Mucilaginibacter boryungensis]|uniref:LacI family DNA-binding transcriptional regulator n=1 Tax=Mucilaginibacter boryungensis TaxID=768480 RepID=A0ABR9XF86_9SPHI|nr:LacI family DNA-binding transcriptional regulator [Mucilaginibacter boryungensis]MBE9665740.1 LacI family DNA-binding transcriptional regulator [Mucilaginibacter boryungensis]